MLPSQDRLALQLPAADTVPMTSLLLRTATTADELALRRLAALDSAAPLRGDVLVAEADGRLVAALSRRDGRVVADPFLPSAAAAEMLRLHAARPAAARRRSPRLAPRAAAA